MFCSDLNIGKMLKETRERKNLNQEDLVLIKRKKSYISRSEIMKQMNCN